MNYNKRQFSKINDKKVLHKVKKQWVVVSLAILMALGGSAAIGYTAHANVTTPAVEATSANSGNQTPQKSDSQKITDQAHALHSSILRNSSNNNRNKQTPGQSNNADQNDQQGNQSSKNPVAQIGTPFVHGLLGRYFGPYDFNDNIMYFNPMNGGNQIGQEGYYYNKDDMAWESDTSFLGIATNQRISINNYPDFPKGYRFINDAHIANLNINDNPPLSYYRKNSVTDNLTGVTFYPSSNQVVFPDNRDRLNFKEDLFPILLTNGNVRVKVVRHHIDGRPDDSHWVNLPSSDLLVSDTSNKNIRYNMSDVVPQSNIGSNVKDLSIGDDVPKGDGYYGDNYTYTLPNNWQSLDQDGFDYQDYLKGYSASDNNSNTLNGTFQLGNAVNEGDSATLSNDVLTLNYNQEPNLTINYYDNINGLLYTTGSKKVDPRYFNIVKDQNNNSTKVLIPTVPDNFSGDYQYNGKCEINGNRSINTPIEYTNGSHSTISYTVNSKELNQTVNIYLTKCSTINVNYINSRTGKVIYDQYAGREPFGTPFDYLKFEGRKTYNYLPKGYELDNDAHDGWNVNPFNYPDYYTNQDQIYKVYVKPISKSSNPISAINVNYIDSKTGKVIYDQYAGREPAGTPFDYLKFEGRKTYNYLPKGYELDNDAHDGWNLNPVNYPDFYSSQDQVYKVYIKPVTVPHRNSDSVINIDYVDSRNNNTVNKQTAGRKPDGTPFDYHDYKMFVEGIDHLTPAPAGYEIDNDARNGWNLDMAHYPSYTDYDQSDIVYVKPVTVPARSTSSVINVNYIDSKTGKVVYDQDAGREPAGTPFDYKKFEGRETFDYLPKGYRLDNNARDGWNLDPAHYPCYTNQDQMDYVYVDQLPAPIVHSHQITIEYLDADNHDSVIAIKKTGSEPDGTPFHIEPYRVNLPENYQLDNSAHDGWNNNLFNYLDYTDSPQTDFIYVKHQTVPVSHQITNTLTVNYRDQNNNPIPGVPSKTEQITYSQSGTQDKVTGRITYSGSWNVINGGWSQIASPDLRSRGYGKPSKAVINVIPAYNSGNETKTVIYHKKNKPNPPAHNVPVRPHDDTSSINRSVTYTLTVNYRDQNGNLIPGVSSRYRSVSYTEDGIKNNKTGAITWYNDWTKHQSGSWSPIMSPDLTSLGYGKPSRQIINDATPAFGGHNKVENVYYFKNVKRHKQVPNTPPVNPAPKPNNPANPKPAPKPPVTPNAPKVPNQPDHKTVPTVNPQRPASKPPHNHTTVVHPDNDVTPTSKHVKLHHLIKLYKHHRRNYQRWIPYLIANHKKNIKYPASHWTDEHITYRLDTVTNRHYNDHQNPQYKLELPKTGESNKRNSAWGAILIILAMIITTFGQAMTVNKHREK